MILLSWRFRATVRRFHGASYAAGGTQDWSTKDLGAKNRVTLNLTGDGCPGATIGEQNEDEIFDGGGSNSYLTPLESRRVSKGPPPSAISSRRQRQRLRLQEIRRPMPRLSGETSIRHHIGPAPRSAFPPGKRNGDVASFSVLNPHRTCLRHNQPANPRADPQNPAPSPTPNLPPDTGITDQY